MDFVVKNKTILHAASYALMHAILILDMTRNTQMVCAIVYVV